MYCYIHFTLGVGINFIDMGLIAMAVHDTVENDRTKYTQATLLSLYDTVDWTKHRMVIINNNSCVATNQLLTGARKTFNNVTTIKINENIGTSRAINMAIRMRESGEVVFKMDNDVIVHEIGWVDKMERILSERLEIGILGLRRDDVYGELIPDGELLINDDIMGTCTAYNPVMLDKIGYSFQPSPFYGGDDVIMSARSLAAGFNNAFVKDIKITHLDDGNNPYCEWKRQEAAMYIQEISIISNMIKSGEMPYYNDGQ